MYKNFDVKVIEHSKWADSEESVLTYALTYPRFIHAECKTHRVISQTSEVIEVLLQDLGLMDDTDLSRNAASSRAIPVERMLDQVMNYPAHPIHWGQNQKGMQAAVENTALVEIPGELTSAFAAWSKEFRADYMPFKVSAKTAWAFSAWLAGSMSGAFMRADYHKQVANRLTEPYQLMQTVVTASKFENFFALRRHKDAQPEIKMLADMMHYARDTSTPRILQRGDWHLPYVLEEERRACGLELLLSISSARTARVSYLTHDGKTPNIGLDQGLHDRLVDAEPPHLSPTEHQVGNIELPSLELQRKYNGNLHGDMVQYRKLVELKESLMPYSVAYDLVLR